MDGSLIPLVLSLTFPGTIFLSLAEYTQFNQAACADGKIEKRHFSRAPFLIR
ncbi:MAG: hypothetical protein ACM3QZ_11090 [Solirubrobacterales bacterium]